MPSSGSTHSMTSIHCLAMKSRRLMRASLPARTLLAMRPDGDATVPARTLSMGLIEMHLRGYSQMQIPRRKRAKKGPPADSWSIAKNERSRNRGKKSESVLGDDGFLLFSNQCNRGVLRREFQCQARAGRRIAHINRSVFGVLRFQNVKHRIVKLGRANQHACRARGLPFKGRLDFERVQEVAVNGGRGVEALCQFRRIGRPKDLPLAVGNLLPRCVVAEAKRFEGGLLLLIESESDPPAGKADFRGAIALRLDLRAYPHIMRPVADLPVFVA